MSDERLARAADRVEIMEVLSRYAQCVDESDWDGLDDLFVEGAVIDFSNNGGARDTFPAIKGYLRESLSIFAAIQHYQTNFAVDLDGDTARVRNYVFTQMVSIVDGADQLLADGGYYDSTLVRTPAGWRLQEYVASLTWLDGTWPEGVPRPGWWGVSADRFSRPEGASS
ncbi:MAG TPA: nuclear transport factor 2 family protein [Iamia sp.]|nr:nuclear transport factor 2 family protein [Iamia sp.]